MSSRTSARVVRPLAFLALLMVVLGIPAALIGIGGSPLSGGVPGWHDITSALSTPDDGTLFAGLLRLLAWAGWALFTLAVVIELVARLRGRAAPKLPALRVPQAAAATLVGLLFAAGPQVAPAAAGTTAQPVVVTAAFSMDTTAADATSLTAPVAPVPAVPAAPALPTEAPTRAYVVRDGDSLWSIAERELGDGRKFAEIAKLNYGVPQPDGRVLENSHWIHPGWTLKLPGAAAPAVPLSGEGGIYTVQPGDTLWSIARARLGDPGRRDEIAAASRSLVQRDGRRLTDPDVIEVGWTLAIPGTPAVPGGPATPGAAAAPVAPPPPQSAVAPPAVVPHVPVPPVTPAVPVPPVVPVPPSAPSQPAAPKQVTPVAEALAGQEAGGSRLLDDAGEVMPVRTTAGLGALLAAGIIALLALRRGAQQRRRRHGRAIPMPVGASAEAEAELRATADTLSVETVDRALRTLAAFCVGTGQSLPVVRAARLTPEQFDLYLAEPAGLPEPWAGTADSLVWTLPVGVPGLLSEAEARQVAAPYPSLVIIGHDEEDGHIFLDLEYVGALGVAGDTDRTCEVLAAIAVELSTSRWADDLQVTVVGAYPELEDALETGRIRYLPAVGHLIDELSVRADEDRSILAVAGVRNLNHARVDGAASGTWTPEIVLLAGHITSHQRYHLGRLIEQLPRVAIAAVVNGEPVGEWCLRLSDDTAILEPMGLQIRPQRIDDQTYGKILDLMSIAATDAEPLAAPDPEPAVADLPAPVDEGVIDLIDLADLTAGEEAAAVRSGPPRLLVLGPVDVVDADGPVEPSKKSRLTELFAYLAFHPGSDFSVIDAAVWPGARTGPNTRNTAMSKLRRWLGTDAAGGDYLPRHQAETGYRLGSDVRSDWDVWCSLLPSGPVGAAPEDLERALRLVRGRPFDGVRVHRYAWAENLKQTMISSIVDASYELAHRRLMENRWRAAEQAIVVGLSLEPGMERLWRLRILAARGSGNPAAEAEAINRMLSVTDDLGGDLEAETEQLLRELRDPSVPVRDRLAFHAL